MQDAIENRPGQEAAAHPGYVSSVRLTALLTAWHMAMCAGRFSLRTAHHRPAVAWAWSVPAGDRVESRMTDERVPSKPVCSFYAGQLALTVGTAVVTLAAWLHIMRISGALGY